MDPGGGGNGVEGSQCGGKGEICNPYNKGKFLKNTNLSSEEKSRLEYQFGIH